MAHEWGLVDDDRWTAYQQRREAIGALTRYAEQKNVEGKRLIEWMRRPEVSERDVLDRFNGDPLPELAREPFIIATLLSDAKYAGFIERHNRDHQRVTAMEQTPLPTNLDYTSIKGIRGEASVVLNRFRPATMGQASRLAGITPADLTVLAMTVART
jgi:tRNA uridine 5-carboxymethylaminomethyl modification enzyme